MIQKLTYEVMFSETCAQSCSSFLILNCISEIFYFWIGSFRAAYWKSQCGQQYGRNNKSMNDFIHVSITFIVCSQKSVFKLVVDLGIWKILTSCSWVLRKFEFMFLCLSKKKNSPKFTKLWTSSNCFSVVPYLVPYDSTKYFYLRDVFNPSWLWR